MPVDSCGTPNSAKLNLFGVVMINKASFQLDRIFLEEQHFSLSGRLLGRNNDCDKNLPSGKLA